MIGSFFWIFGSGICLALGVAHHWWVSVGLNVLCCAVWMLRMRTICVNEEFS